MVSGRVTLTATLTPETMTLAIDNGKPLSQPSPGLIPVQPADDLSIGFDHRSSAGDYNAPNPFNGKVIRHAVTPSDKPPRQRHEPTSSVPSVEPGKATLGGITKPFLPAEPFLSPR